MSQEIDLSNVTFEQLRIRYFSFRCTSRKVSRYLEHKGSDYAVTQLGEIEMGQWAAMAEQLIAFHHEEQLQDQMLKWVQETDYTNSTEREKKQQSLDLHVSRMFDDPLWVHYVRFNQRFRPDALKNARLVRIKTACCDKPGLTTHEQIDHARGSEGGKVIFCPHCGRWSEFMLTESPESENDEKRCSTPI